MSIPVFINHLIQRKLRISFGIQAREENKRISEKIAKKDMEWLTNFNNIDILIVDDDAQMRETLNDILSEEGYKITGTGTISLAKEELKKKFYNIVLLDLKLPDGTGLELLKEIKSINGEIAVLVFTGFASLESSIFALNEGAFAYIQKPLNIDELKIFIKRALNMQKLSLDNRNLINRLKELSLKDTHTELYNYRYLIERLTSEIKNAARYSCTLSIMMIDIDYFKSINDVYGHQYGDIILKEFAQYLRDSLRGSDVVTRYGGEEFVILLPHTSKEDASISGEELLDAIRKHAFGPEDKRIKLKVSIGISGFPEDGSDVDTLLNSADKALLNVKEMGGNRLFAFKGASKDVEDIVEESTKEEVEKLRKKLSKMVNRVNQTLLESIYAFAKTIEARDYYTGEHAESMISIVTKIGRRLNLSNNVIESLKHAAVLHDLGKIGIPDNILHKPGKLTKEEYEIIKKHPQIGAEIIRAVHFLRELVPLILYHHERYDGTGYPKGLKGEGIPLGARIITIADVYQALVSDRPYRKAYSEKEALEIIREGSGTQFDPQMVDVFMEMTQSKSDNAK